MSDYDTDIARQVERDGVRTMSGHHARVNGPDHPVIRGRTGDTRCIHDERDGCDYCNPEKPEGADPWVDRRDHYDR